MQEKNEDDERNRDPFFNQFVLKIFHRPFNQGRAVINRDDLYPVREAALKVCKFCFYAFDNLQRILAVSHDDDTGNCFAFAV